MVDPTPGPPSPPLDGRSRAHTVRAGRGARASIHAAS